MIGWAKRRSRYRTRFTCVAGTNPCHAVTPQRLAHILELSSPPLRPPPGKKSNPRTLGPMIAMCSPNGCSVAESLTFALPFRPTGVINRHAHEAQKRIRKTTMNNAEADTAATVGEKGATVAPEKAPSKKGASQKKGAPKGPKAGKGAKTKTAATKKTAKRGKKTAKPARTKESSAPRAESKGAKILALIGRPKGATLAEIMKAVDWQAHSVRGYLSSAAKKHGLKIDSSKNDAGDRVYRIAK